MILTSHKFPKDGSKINPSSPDFPLGQRVPRIIYLKPSIGRLRTPETYYSNRKLGIR